MQHNYCMNRYEELDSQVLCLYLGPLSHHTRSRNDCALLLRHITHLKPRLRHESKLLPHIRISVGWLVSLNMRLLPRLPLSRFRRLLS